ncbi:hypothetical protein DFH94DRAFT_695668 [Russula ochroleuca]|uniref:Uncharacterized protein n=1 Tax=Russula ochroleuca TaxID=152965 RepID=A0A9P5MN88_9AGAM|nr:hypothetical protein DFH94DRAFT_695668 [Russula ochroleuca]
MPGDPSNDNYDDMLPDFCHPLVLTMGVVSSAPDGGSGGPVTFPVSVSEYIRGAMKDSTIIGRIDKSTAHWKNVPSPGCGAIVSLIGTCFDISDTGLLSIALDNIVYCPSTPQPLGALANAEPTGNKHHKFGTHVATCPDPPSDALPAQPPASSLQLAPIPEGVLPKPSSNVMLALSALNDLSNGLLPASFGKPQQSVASAKCGELVGEPSKSSVAEGVVPSTRSKGKHKAQN